MTLRSISKSAIHPIFFAFFPILSLFAHNVGELTLNDLTEPVLLSVSLSLIIWAASNFIIQDRLLSALTTSLIFLLFFSYGPLARILNLNPSLPYLYYSYSALSIFAAWHLTAVFMKRASGVWVATKFLNVTSLLVLMVPIFIIAIGQLPRLDQNIKRSNLLLSADKKVSSEKLPDIYYLIIDSYARNQSLKDYFDFDNSDFTNFLISKGFYVADQSRSNYPYTIASLASSLNMVYLDEVTKQVGKTSPDLTPLLDLIEDNQVILYLKSRGYKYLHFGARSLFTEGNKNADFVYVHQSNRLNLSSLSQMLLSQTVLDPMLSSVDCLNESSFLCVGILNNNRSYYNYLLDQMKSISEATKEKGPKFVFLHSTLIHGPFVFTPDGKYLPSAVEQSRGWRQNYTDQVVFTNTLLKSFIENILKNSETTPLIILQSDEGTYPDRFRGEKDNYFWRSATSDELKEKVRILNAYYLSDKATKKLYPSITPVNSFRIILNTYFGENLPLLKDQSFIQSQKKYPLDFLDITNIVK